MLPSQAQRTSPFLSFCSPASHAFWFGWRDSCSSHQFGCFVGILLELLLRGSAIMNRSRGGVESGRSQENPDLSPLYGK